MSVGRSRRDASATAPSRKISPRRRWIGAGVGTVLLLCGCGNSRTPVPQVRAPALPGGFRVVNLPSAGARLSVPRSWILLGTHSRLLLVLDTSGGAVIALWRYPVEGLTPQGVGQLARARQRLIASARSRDPFMHVLSSSLARISGRPAITLMADERIGTAERRVVSTHVFTRSEELVLEEYAPFQVFRRVDQTAFSPVLDSLQVSG